MTKDELIEEVARKSGVTKDEALKVINVLTEEIREQLDRGEKVSITGFGTFILSENEKKE